MENRQPIRIVIRTCVTDIPGDPCARPNTLGQLFCSKVLGRDFEGVSQSYCYDHAYIPPRFDSEYPVKEWFIFDLNVTGMISKKGLLGIPHEIFSAKLKDDQW